MRCIALAALSLSLAAPSWAQEQHASRAAKSQPAGQAGEHEFALETQDQQSIEERTKVHRLSSTKRTAYDAFVYVNRIPEKAEEGETSQDLAGRIFGRLANQEGRILLKLPLGMNREAYLGFKTFLRYEGTRSVGNCAACHSPPEFTDLKSHVVNPAGLAKPTPSLRNLKKAKVDLRKTIMDKIAASEQKRAGADEINEAYAAMHLGRQDVAELVAFLGSLNDTSDAEFRKLILNAKLLDTSEDIGGDDGEEDQQE